MKNFFRNVNPAMLILLGVMVVNQMLSPGQSIGAWIYDKIILLPAIIIGLTFHEAAHGYVSYWLGDPTPKIQGRLSLNPIHHIDPLGFLALMFCGFGWGEPVRIDPRYYKNRRRDELLVGLAGVVTNFLIALGTSFIIKALLNNMTNEFYYGIGGILLEILINIFAINIVLMVFNLIPVPPLDGFGILTQIFKLDRFDWYWKIYQNGFLILMVLIIFDVTDMILGPVCGFFYDLLLY